MATNCRPISLLSQFDKFLRNNLQQNLFLCAKIQPLK